MGNTPVGAQRPALGCRRGLPNDAALSWDDDDDPDDDSDDGGSIDVTGSGSVAADEAGDTRELSSVTAGAGVRSGGDGSPARTPGRTRAVAVFMVRHAERIDETAAGADWRRQAGERWFDPPLSERGRTQAAEAAAQLRAFLLAQRPGEFAPFDRVYCSPLVRTLQTAEEFGRVFGVPVVPVPGIATCTASFKTHGADHNALLDHAAALSHCRHSNDVAVEPYDAAYDAAAADKGHFADTVATLASIAVTAQRAVRRARTHLSTRGGAGRCAGRGKRRNGGIYRDGDHGGASPGAKDDEPREWEREGERAREEPARSDGIDAEGEGPSSSGSPATDNNDSNAHDDDDGSGGGGDDGDDGGGGGGGGGGDDDDGGDADDTQAANIGAAEDGHDALAVPVTCCLPGASGLRLQRQRHTRPRPAILVVTHREGLRDVGLLTPEPFMQTRYCCVALFGHHRARGWSIRHSPEDFRMLQEATARAPLSGAEPRTTGLPLSPRAASVAERDPATQRKGGQPQGRGRGANAARKSSSVAVPVPLPSVADSDGNDGDASPPDLTHTLHDASPHVVRFQQQAASAVAVAESGSDGGCREEEEESPTSPGSGGDSAVATVW